MNRWAWVTGGGSIVLVTLLVFFFVLQGRGDDSAVQATAVAMGTSTMPPVTSSPTVEATVTTTATAISLHQVHDETVIRNLREVLEVREDLVIIPVEVRGYALENLTSEQTIAAVEYSRPIVGLGSWWGESWLEADVLVFFLLKTTPPGEYPVSFAPPGQKEATILLSLK